MTTNLRASRVLVAALVAALVALALDGSHAQTVTAESIDATCTALHRTVDGDSCGDCLPNYKAATAAGTCRHTPEPLQVVFDERTEADAFAATLTVAAINEPWCFFAFADLDGDGQDDLVAGVDNFAWYRNEGGNSIATLPTADLDIGGFSCPENVVFADFDGDGDLDCLVADYRAPFELEDIGFFRNDGNVSMPAFVAAPNDPFPEALYAAITAMPSKFEDSCFSSVIDEYSSGALSNCMRTLSVTDLDNDGDLDIFILPSLFPEVMYLRNVGTLANPQFVNAVSTLNPFNGIAFESPETMKSTLHFADFDFDGDLDAYLIGIPENEDDTSTITYYRNRGNAQTPRFALVENAASPFALTSSYQNASTTYLRVGRVQDSKDFLLLMIDSQEKFTALLSRPTRGVDAYTGHPMPLLDIDNMLAHYGVGNRTFRIFSLGTQKWTFVDYDGDGDLDYIQLFNGFPATRADKDSGYTLIKGVRRVDYVWAISNVGSSDRPEFSFSGSIPALEDLVNAAGRFIGAEDPDGDGLFNVVIDDIATVDLDGDGDFDMVLASDNLLIYVPNMGNGTHMAFKDAVNHTLSPFREIELDGPCYIAFADVDGDGDQDLLTLGSTGFAFFRNDGSTRNPAFLPVEDSNQNPFGHLEGFTSDTHTDLMFTDIDADGDVDLVFALQGDYVSRYPTESDYNSFTVRNTGNATYPHFEAAKEKQFPYDGSVLGDRYRIYQGYADLDGDGDVDRIEQLSDLTSFDVVLNFNRNTARECLSDCSSRGYCMQPDNNTLAALGGVEKALLDVDSIDAKSFDDLVGVCICTSSDFEGNACELCASDVVYGRDCNQSCPAFSRTHTQPAYPLSLAIDDCVCDEGFVGVDVGDTFECHCPAGSFVNSEAGRCDPCPLGTFSEEPSADTSCAACAPYGSLTAALGATEKSMCVCPADRVEANGTCVCAIGFYQQEGDDASVCGKCPAERPFTLRAGALSESECVVPTGTMLVNGEVETCDAEFVDCEVAGATLETVSVKEGYWRISSTSTEFLECPERAFCKGGAYGDYCSAHHVGILCVDCESGYAMRSDTCEPCTAAATSRDRAISAVVWIFAVILLFTPAAVTAIKWKYSNDSLDDERQTSGLLTMVRKWLSQARESLSVILPHFGVKLRITLVFYQLYTQFVKVIGVETSAASVLGAFVDLNLGRLLGILQVGCSYSGNFYTQLLLSTVLPIVAIGAVAVVAWIAQKMSGVTTGTRAALQFATWCAFQILWVVYSGIAATLTETFLSHEMPRYEGDEDPYMALRVDYSIDFDSTASRRARVYAGFMFALYPVGVGVLFSVSAWCLKKGWSQGESLSRKAMAEGIAFLLKPYRENRFWFESFELWRRFVLTSIFILVTQVSGSGGILFFTLACVLFAWFVELVAPYTEATDFWLARVSMILLVCLGAVALSMKLNLCDESLATKLFRGIAVLELMAFVLSLVIVFHAKKKSSRTKSLACDEESSQGSTDVFRDDSPFVQVADVLKANTSQTKHGASFASSNVDDMEDGMAAEKVVNFS
ncbi:Thyroglobulin [Hondaea fermentalgiana]|uniref:Thyroglobulin n=1 Tax=Hondaea fermentalgiana TaxID=2315210 RepID=A0A2R5GJR1_9STRA|nr:Thyroglobulin [Hondaea fermentalgiana]|eukprot:GBG31120.1 Thyroglobulin [Hondaea fermentalgiana]